MPSKQKVKGSAWEREVAKHLSEIYELPFIRIPTSGAYLGGVNAYRRTGLTEGQILSRRGDIQPPDGWNRWNCECKSYAEFPFHQLFTGEVKLLDSWINQVYDVAEADDLNVIFMKISRKGKWVAYEDNAKFQVEESLKYKKWVFCAWEKFWTPHNIDQLRRIATHMEEECNSNA